MSCLRWAWEKKGDWKRIWEKMDDWNQTSRPLLAKRTQWIADCS